MEKERSNAQFILASVLLTARLNNTGIIIQKLEFEDGSGNNFTGQLWNTQGRNMSYFFFRIDDNMNMADFNTWYTGKREVKG
jgi:hypothetical protein